MDEPAKGSGFTRIANGLLDSEELSPEARYVSFYYARHMNNGDRLSWPGNGRLRRMTGLGINTIKRARKELLDAGYLRKVQIRGSRGQFGQVKYAVSEKIVPPRLQRASMSQDEAKIQCELMVGKRR